MAGWLGPEDLGRGWAGRSGSARHGAQWPGRERTGRNGPAHLGKPRRRREELAKAWRGRSGWGRQRAGQPRTRLAGNGAAGSARYVAPSTAWAWDRIGSNGNEALAASSRGVQRQEALGRSRLRPPGLGQERQQWQRRDRSEAERLCLQRIAMDRQEALGSDLRADDLHGRARIWSGSNGSAADRQERLGEVWPPRACNGEAGGAGRGWQRMGAVATWSRRGRQSWLGNARAGTGWIAPQRQEARGVPRPAQAVLGLEWQARAGVAR